MAQAAKRVIITCEEIVPRETIVANAHMTKVPGYYVDAVIEAPFGAHPTSHVPIYPLDPWQLMEYAGAATGEGWGDYLERIRTESEDEYRARVLGNGRETVLRSLVQEAKILEVAR